MVKRETGGLRYRQKAFFKTKTVVFFDRHATFGDISLCVYLDLYKSIKT